MKVSKESDQFKPITIVLETKEEADWMWACFNVPISLVVDVNIGRIKDIEKLTSKNNHQKMFNDFDDIYSP